MDGGPPGSIATCHKAGWIQKETFTQWFTHFFRFAKPSIEDHFNLTLVVHYPHSRTIDVIECSREKGGAHRLLPPHNTPELQLLGFIFMLPLKTYHAE
jgi:hypothetical protein